MLTDPLKKALRDEAQALNEFAAGQKRLQELIGKRQWTRLQVQIDELKSLATRVEALEDRRVSSYRKLKRSLGGTPAGSPEAQRRESERFEEIVTHLPAADRDELFGLYRQLKLAVIRVKGNAGLLGFYLRSLSGTVQKVLEELFPHRRGTIYSRSGRSCDAGDHSLVVHRHV